MKREMREDRLVAQKPIDCTLGVLAIALAARALLGFCFFLLRPPLRFSRTLGLRAIVADTSHGPIPFRLERFQFGVMGGI